MNTDNEIVFALVDDSDSDRFIYGRLLRRAFPDARVVELDDGTKAEQYLIAQGANGEQRPFPPDVMLVDINMPLLDGFSFLERVGDRLQVEREGSPVVVMMLSSSDRDDDKKRALSLPIVVDYLVKDDVSSELLADRVQYHLGASPG